MNPLQAFYFVIFILVLQQVDGNVIGPKILGNTVGISGFWVLASITIAASLFGFAGMILGVPVFAIIYLLISDSVNNKLRKKNLTTDTTAYGPISEVAELAKQVTQLDTQMQQLKGLLVSELDGKDCATCADGEQSYVISYNPIRRQGISKDNMIRLREVYPEIYEQFVETSESRRFSIKIAAQPAA